MSDYNMTRGLRFHRIYRNAVDHCAGVLSASHFWLPIESDESVEKKKGNLMLNEQSEFLQLVVACLFYDCERAWEMSEKLGQFGRAFAGSIWPFTCAFYRGMSAIAMLRISKDKHFIETAKSCLKQLRKGRKKVPTNLAHQSYLLEAEYAVFRKKYVSAEKFYSLAIQHVHLAGVIQEHAYICERFGSYHLLRKNHNAAYEQIREAHRLYAQWGE